MEQSYFRAMHMLAVRISASNSNKFIFIYETKPFPWLFI